MTVGTGSPSLPGRAVSDGPVSTSAGRGTTTDPKPAIPFSIPAAAVERFVEAQRAVLVDRARDARDAITEVLSDARIRTHGMTFSQFARLADARDELSKVLP